MRRRDFVATTGIATAAALSGCTSALGEETNTNTTVEELHVQQVEQDTIRTTGSGAVETDPDRATFTVSVEAHDRDDASAVVDDLSEQADELLAALLEYGVDEDDVTTTRYDLSESSRRNRYEGEHRYRVEVDDPDAVGEVIDVAVDAGADSVGRVQFTLSEQRREELYDDAVEEAVEDAREEAEMYSSAAGQALGDPTSIETSQTGHAPFRQRLDVEFAADADDGAATQIEQGEVAVTAEVTVEYLFDSS